MTDTDYMKQALLEAQKAGERGEVPVGAVVVCKDRIIARAHNLTEDEKRGYQRYAPQALHPKTSVVKGVLADECAALMKDFFAAKRR